MLYNLLDAIKKKRLYRIWRTELSAIKLDEYQISPVKRRLHKTRLDVYFVEIFELKKKKKKHSVVKTVLTVSISSFNCY